eukprot:scaffold7006_cov108-Isochrysis_galbana.AAC.3
MASRYRMFYDTVVRPDMLAKMQYKNVHMVPKLDKVTVSIATHMKPTGLDNPIAAAFALELITGQQAQLTRVKKANAKYKVRTGMLEGAKVVLHGDNMYHFLDRLVTTVLPRITDFEGLDRRSFDAHGGYALGIRDWSSFIEVESQHENLQPFGVQQSPGLGVQILTTATTEPEAHMLLSALRFPFKK